MKNMFTLKKLFLSLFISISMLFFTTSVLAGGWPIYTYIWGNPDQWQSSGAPKMMYVRAHLAPDVACKGTTVTFKYESPQSGDNVSTAESNGSYTLTEDSTDCAPYAKFFSTNNSEKIGIVEFKTADGKVYSGRFALNFQLSAPVNTDSEEKLPLPWNINSPTPSLPKGKIDIWVLEQRFIEPEYREVIVKFGWPETKGNIAYNIYAKKVNDGDWQKMISLQDGPSTSLKLKAYDDYQLKAEGCIKKYGNCVQSGDIFVPKLDKPTEGVEIPVPSIIPGSKVTPPPVVVSSETTQLEQKIDNLQKQLQESQKRQSVLEKQLNKIMNWIKSVFPFFKL